MLDIKLRSASLVFVFGAAAVAAGCAGKDDPSPDPITSASVSVSAPSSASVTASSTASGLASSRPSSSPSTSSTVPSNGGCATTGYTAVTEGFTFPGAVQVFGNTDMAGSTACIEATPAATCLKGKVTLAGDDYENWGTQIGFQLVHTDADGVAAAPMNAAALGIVGFRFTLTGAGTSGKGKPPKVRLQVAMTDLDGVKYQSYAYAKDGSYTGDYTADQTAVVVDFTDITAPDWAHTALDATHPDGLIPEALDATRLHSVQFQVTTDQTNEHDYNVCLSAFDWLDAAGNVVVVEAPVLPTDDGGTPPVGDGGADTGTDDAGPTDDGSVPPVGDAGDGSVAPIGDGGLADDASVPDSGDASN